MYKTLFLHQSIMLEVPAKEVGDITTDLGKGSILQIIDKEQQRILKSIIDKDTKRGWPSNWEFDKYEIARVDDVFLINLTFRRETQVYLFDTTTT